MIEPFDEKRITALEKKTNDNEFMIDKIINSGEELEMRIGRLEHKVFELKARPSQKTGGEDGG